MLQLVCIDSNSVTVHVWGEFGSIRLLLYFLSHPTPLAISFSVWTNPALSDPSHKQYGPDSEWYWWSSAGPTKVRLCLSWPGRPKAEVVLQVLSHNCWIERNSLDLLPIFFLRQFSMWLVLFAAKPWYRLMLYFLSTKTRRSFCSKMLPSQTSSVCSVASRCRVWHCLCWTSWIFYSITFATQNM